MYTQTPRAADTRLRESANGAARVVWFSARALIANAIGACPNNADARTREARPAAARADLGEQMFAESATVREFLRANDHYL